MLFLKKPVWWVPIIVVCVCISIVIFREDPDKLAYQLIHDDLGGLESMELAHRIIRDYPYSEAALKTRYHLLDYSYDENGKRQHFGLEETVESLKDMLKYHPHSARVLADIAVRLYIDSPKETIAFAQKALRIDSSNLDAYKALGRAYQRLGDYKTALVYLKRALKLSETSEKDDFSDTDYSTIVIAVIMEDGYRVVTDYDLFAYEIAMIVAGRPRFGPDPESLVLSDDDVPLESDKAFESFLRWMEAIESAKCPLDLEDFLMREVWKYLHGEASGFTPERLMRAYEVFERHGEAAGLRELEKLDAALARELLRSRVPSTRVPDRPDRRVPGSRR